MEMNMLLPHKMKTFMKTTETVFGLLVTVSLAVQVHAQTFLTNGLVAYYPFSGNANDTSGNGNNGTVQGATLTTDRFGNANQAYLFSGTSYITASLSSTRFGTNFTASVWFNADDINNSWPTLLEEVGNTAFVMGIAGQTSGGSIGNLYAFATHAQPNKDWELLPLFQPSLNKYYQAVVVRAGTNVMMYWNGTLGATNQVVNPTVEPGNTFYIGCSGDNLSSDYVFHGVIDDIRIYNRALSSNEVAQLYAYESALQLTDGLVAYYPFNGNANDASGNGHNGTVYGGTTMTTNRFGQANAAYDFDGSTGYIGIPQNSVLNSLTTNFTLSAWIWQRESITNGYRILDKETAGNGDGWSFDTYNCIDQTGNRLRLEGANANNSCNVPGETEYSLMQWHHVVATVSGTNGKVYLDGTLEGSGNVGNIPVNTLDVYIGLAHPGRGSGFWFNGHIDDVRIYNRTLSDSEVQQLYAIESGPRVDLIKAVKPSFSNLTLTTNYQLQVSGDLSSWTNQGSVFTATNNSMVYPQYWDVDNWDELFFRLQVAP